MPTSWFLPNAEASAPEAVVIKPQAPLYLEWGNQESVVEYRIKGDLLTIYDNHMVPANLAEIYTLPYKQPYYQTFDRNGRLVYVSINDVEVYFNDEREIEAAKKRWSSSP